MLNLSFDSFHIFHSQTLFSPSAAKSCLLSIWYNVCLAICVFLHCLIGLPIFRHILGLINNSLVGLKRLHLSRSWGIFVNIFCGSVFFLSPLITFSLSTLYPFFLFPSSSSTHCVSVQVVSQRFPQNSIGAVGSAMFLRFINPAIVSPYEAGILDKKPPPRIERGLKLMSKVRHLVSVLQCGHDLAKWLLIAIAYLFS